VEPERLSKLNEELEVVLQIIEKNTKREIKQKRLKNKLKRILIYPFFRPILSILLGHISMFPGFFQNSLLKASDTEIRISVFGMPASEFLMRSSKKLLIRIKGIV
jgi:hypothetical protein